MNEYCEYLIGKTLQVDSPPKNVHEMKIFINTIEVRQSDKNQYFNQIKMFAPTQLAELCMNRLETQDTPVVIQKFIITYLIYIFNTFFYFILAI